MYGMIKDRKQEIKLGETSTTVRRDLFNQLITASLDEEAAEMGEKGSGSQGLTDEELVGYVTGLYGEGGDVTRKLTNMTWASAETPSSLPSPATRPRRIPSLSPSDTSLPTPTSRNGCMKNWPRSCRTVICP